MMWKAMFTSEHDLERAENLRAVWDAYDGPKEFVRGIWHMASAPQDGYSVVVCDSLPAYMPYKLNCKSIVIGHGVIGKKYALDEPRDGIDKAAFTQIDVAVCPSTKLEGIIAGQFGITDDRVQSLGFPRTDQYVRSEKGDGGTVLASYRRAYLYAPTFRGSDDAGWLPSIDWEKLDGMLEDDEIIAVKRHYFQREPIVGKILDRVFEIEPDNASAPYIKDCDVLMTDYSSIVVDGYLAGKPSVLTVDDMDEYLSTRGMNLSYPDDYGSRTIVAEGHEEELLEMLREAAENGMRGAETACAALVADMCDGHSTERVCDLIRRLA